MLNRLYIHGACFVSWLLFGVCSVVVNAACALLLLLPNRERCGRWVREVLRRFFSAWSAWLRLVGLIQVNWHGFENVPLRGSAIWVANHPSLLDATFLLGRLPDVVCVFKRSMLRNPFLAPAAVMAGHIACSSSMDFVRASVEKVSKGRTLLIFPEGTRTDVHCALNPCKNGFALIAARAAVPIQIVVIRASRDLLPRGRRWWQMPHFPTTVDIYAEERLEPMPERSVRETAALVEQRLAAHLTESHCLV
jgi:1-acyl-sn-glycerol-3-phosphate acyltransferase